MNILFRIAEISARLPTVPSYQSMYQTGRPGMKRKLSACMSHINSVAGRQYTRSRMYILYIYIYICLRYTSPALPFRFPARGRP